MDDIYRVKLIQKNDMIDHKKEKNPMYGKVQSETTRQLMSETQKKRYKAINKLLYQLREDQLNLRIKDIVKQMLAEQHH